MTWINSSSDSTGVSWTSTGTSATDGTSYVHYAPNAAVTPISYTEEELQRAMLLERHGKISRHLNHNEEHKLHWSNDISI